MSWIDTVNDPLDEPPTTNPDNDTRHIHLTPAANIKPRPVWWLWKNRLALGTLGLLAGREGAGKSTLAYWITARLTQGELYGYYYGKPKAVLVVAAEDSWEHTIVPRLIAAGANLNLVHRVEVLSTLGLLVGMKLPGDLLSLEKSAIDTGAALLLLDPLMSRLGDLDTHRDAEVRQALEPLVAVADRVSMSVLGIIHHNKSGSSDPLQLVMGSKAFTAVARSVHTVVTDPDDDTRQRRLFGTPKNNLGRSDLPTFTFTINSYGVDTDEGTAFTSQMEWGEELAASIDDTLQRATELGEDRGATVDAAEWLGDYIASKGGQVPSADAKRAGKAVGHPERTLQRATRRLKLIISSSGFPRITYWELPPETTPTLDIDDHGRARARGVPDIGATGATDRAEKHRGEISHTQITTTTQSRQPRQLGQPPDSPRARGATDRQPCSMCPTGEAMPGRGICPSCDQATSAP